MNCGVVRFLSTDKKLFIYRIPVFTCKSYKTLIEDRGSTYVLELFMEVCRDNRCRFLGLDSDGEYIYALLGFENKEAYERGEQARRLFGRGDSAFEQIN